MAYELPEDRPVFLAEGKSLFALVDAAILVLARVDIEQINDLKDKWIPLGLQEAMREASHPFWVQYGQMIFEDIAARIAPHLPESYYFATHPEIPELVGIFKRGEEDNIKHRARRIAAHVILNADL